MPATEIEYYGVQSPARLNRNLAIFVTGVQHGFEWIGWGGGRNKRTDVEYIQLLLNHSISSLALRPPLVVSGFCDRETEEGIRQFQTQVMHSSVIDGRIEPNSNVLRTLMRSASLSRNFAETVRKVQATQAGKVTPVSVLAPAAGIEQLYTTDPNEQIDRLTLVQPRELMPLIQSAWSVLTKEGVHTIAAQCMIETGNGEHCHNWNLGNIKSPYTKNPHSYLKQVTETGSAKAMQMEVANSRGPSHIASEQEMARFKWHCDQNQRIGVFYPPSTECRFRSFATLPEGVLFWIAKLQTYIHRVPTFLASINSGDCITVANILAQQHYYTGDPEAYGKVMLNRKHMLDRLDPHKVLK